MEKLLARKKLPPQERKIGIGNAAVFVLSQKCNLACSYCYAHNSRSQDTLSASKIQTVVDFILSSQSEETKHFSFIGGGEPTVTWELFVWAVTYIKNKAESRKHKTSIGLTTNATLLDEERVNWLKLNDVQIGISFDILPEIQNAQRGFPDRTMSSFEVADKCIKLLIDNGFTPRIRSTITKQNVCLMPEMVTFVVHNYPGIKRLHFEHVTDTGLTQDGYYDNFILHFFKAKDFGIANGIEVKNSIVNNTRYIRSRFCGGEFCITPTGDLVSCHRVSSNKEDSFDRFAYGFVDDKVNIDENNLIKAVQYLNNKPQQCADCFAKWHCAGGCTHKKVFFSPEQFSAHCKFTKDMITRVLESKLLSSVSSDKQKLAKTTG
jgi:radical SAM protein with 4Fe4S-binding SPASM domain